jgi:hypothetical protein
VPADAFGSASSRYGIRVALFEDCVDVDADADANADADADADAVPTMNAAAVAHTAAFRDLLMVNNRQSLKKVRREEESGSKR